ncbi:MAG TPA: glycosyl hydrolase [Steroidobacteraceae bacterium]|nr:glycosyl hydrolase [Steroidobacteraceae bacterium]
MKTPYRFFILALGMGPILALAADLRAVHVDAGKGIGTIRSLQGVNGAPGPNAHKPIRFTFGGWNVPADTDATAGYREARIDLVRTHDGYGPGDIDARFPDTPNALIDPERSALSMFPNPDADPRDPRSYNFGPTDAQIGSIKAVGAEVLFRLGRSEGSIVDPPRNLDKYAEIAKHVVLHYNRGWANGFHYRIKYWEVWNEPDLGRYFWGGSPQLFFQLYEKIARAVKEADRDALVGGPAIAQPNDTNPYIDDFLTYVRTRKVPLDFYSWHWYATDSNDPLDLIRVGEAMRTHLDRRGFRKTLSVLDEWNYGLLEPGPPDEQRAAFVASALIYMQDAPIDVSALYRADNLFGRKGTTPDKTGNSLIALGRMQDTPVRLATTGGDDKGFAVQAGRSRDGDRVQVLISNYEIPANFLGPRNGPNALDMGDFAVKLLERRSIEYRNNDGYDIQIDNLDPRSRYSVESYRISADADLSLSRSTEAAGPTIRLSAELPPPGVELIVIRKKR